MMTHSRRPSSFVAVAFACCSAVLPSRAAALEHPSSQAVANASLTAETVVAPSPPATTQASAAKPVEQSRVWSSQAQQDLAETAVGSPSPGQIQSSAAEPGEQGRLGGGEAQQLGRSLAASRPWYLSPVSALAVVVVLILVAAWVAKRLLPGMRRDGKRGPMQVLATTYLSPKQSLALVRCGRRVILIGVTPEHISSLAVMDETSDLPNLAHAPDRDDGERLSGQFNEALEDAAKDFGRNDAAWDEPLGPDERELSAARQEIRGLLDRVRTFAGNRL